YGIDYLGDELGTLINNAYGGKIKFTDNKNTNISPTEINDQAFYSSRPLTPLISKALTLQSMRLNSTDIFHLTQYPYLPYICLKSKFILKILNGSMEQWNNELVKRILQMQYNAKSVIDKHPVSLVSRRKKRQGSEICRKCNFKRIICDKTSKQCKNCYEASLRFISGNKLIDDFIELTQFSYASFARKSHLEFIPYEQFTNIEYLAKGGYIRIGNHKVVLKILNDSEKMDSDFLNEVCTLVNKANKGALKFADNKGTNISPTEINDQAFYSSRPLTPLISKALTLQKWSMELVQDQTIISLPNVYNNPFIELSTEFKFTNNNPFMEWNANFTQTNTSSLNIYNNSIIELSASITRNNEDQTNHNLSMEWTTCFTQDRTNISLLNTYNSGITQHYDEQINNLQQQYNEKSIKEDKHPVSLVSRRIKNPKCKKCNLRKSCYYENSNICKNCYQASKRILSGNKLIDDFIESTQTFQATISSKRKLYDVALKILNNSEKIDSDFLNEIKNFFRCKKDLIERENGLQRYLGITQHPETKN
ncbi:36780_t:CDS:2, partial [Gigaspora margarita]